MSASIFERIAEEVKLALRNQVPGIDERVFRGREDAIGDDEGDTVNVWTDDNTQRTFSDAIDDNELSIGVSIYVRGDVWESKADAYAVQIHPLVMKRDYAAAGLKLARVRLTDQAWLAEDGDNTPGKRTMKFAFRFLTYAADITAQP